MILCRFNNHWFLCTGIDLYTDRCWLRSGPKMHYPDTFQPLPPAGSVMHGSIEGVEHVTFYPEIRYDGLRVFPENWHFDNTDPVVMCHIPSPRRFPNESKEAVQQHREELIAQGFEDGGREGLKGYVHVDDLEKIEGPPPEGPF